MSQKKDTHLAGSEIKNMMPIIKTEMIIHQSIANLDEKILFGKIAHHLDPKIGNEVLVKGMFGNEYSTFHSGQ